MQPQAPPTPTQALSTLFWPRGGRKPLAAVATQLGNISVYITTLQLVLSPAPWGLLAHAMGGQVIGPGERTLAKVALERTLARVLSEMTRQLIGAGKLPTASFPAAVVRALGVGFATTSESTGVCRRPFPRPGAASSLRLGFHQLEWRRRWREEYPLRGGRHPEPVLVQAELVGALIVELHRSWMRVREARGRVVALREGHRAAHTLLAVGAHWTLWTKRRGHAACGLW
ncbi:hypothetical protein JZ751_014191 [Albula glossodonta]|uniref:Uncharacterized protein n=1 Tax=Albula glossodonta TaxID=121402 RepID=A0A8T2P0P0_9TELE|nr:hypothetical protein JZ751_014191 [Albula glossodonta]